MANILIVEDEKVLNEAYALVLKKEGYGVVTAFNGEEALEAAKKQEFDLILLDLRMPKIGGVEFLQNFKVKQNHPETKIIIFSNYDDEKEVNDAIELGADRYILKAWSSPNELIKLVRESIDKKP